MYLLHVKKKALKEIAALPQKEQVRIISAMASLQEDPFAGTKLHGEYDGAWSFRVWPYRIIYTVSQKTVTVTVLRVGHRQGVYK
jgi:addiction module RelE/StbE family toxin